MEYKLFTISDEQQKILRSMEKFTGDDVRSFMQGFSTGKIKKAKAGKLSITNTSYSALSELGLAKHEGHYVFFALEKQKPSFFSKASYRVFLWSPNFEAVFALPVGSVSFETPMQNATETMFLMQKGQEHALCKQSYGGQEHVCFFKKMELYREFAVEEAKMTCTKDFAVHYFRWTKPDPWVREHFRITENEEPMFYLRHDAREIPGWSVQLSYPSRPPLFGWEIDE